MRKIPVGDGLFAKVDDEDYEVLSHFHWHYKRPNPDGQTTILVRTKWRAPGGVQHQRNMSAIIVGGQKGKKVTFLNGDRLDHRRENLLPKGPPLSTGMGSKLADLIAERDILNRKIATLVRKEMVS